MESAFGVDHGDISKALAGVIPQAARGAKQFGQGVKIGYKTSRSNRLAARKQAGLATTFGGSVKQGIAAGRAGQGPQIMAASRQAARTGRANTVNQLRRP